MADPHQHSVDPDRPERFTFGACPMCTAPYHPLTTRVIAARDEHHLLYRRCQQCGSRLVMMVTTDAAGMHTVGVVTDVTSAELVTLANATAITTDDVLDVHAWFTHPSTVIVARSSTGAA